MADGSTILQNGTLVGGTYKILSFLGHGAMGAVYKVEHIHLNKIMALKLLRPEIMSVNVWRRFQIEAKAIARLDHANIIQIYDMSQTEDGLPYYTMDYLEGQSLDHVISEGGPIAVEIALPIFRQICNGLAYAHERGILHRDIKPGNIMLASKVASGTPGNPATSGTAGGAGYTAKIVDFGIAKLIDTANTAEQGLTKPGEIFGTPLYMSPEQCAGAKLDQRSDIYSLGVTFFQALTGRPPVLGKSALETMSLHQTAQPLLLNDTDFAKANPFSSDLEDIIDRMLARSPEDRYASLSQVASDLLSVERSKNYRQGNAKPLLLGQSKYGGTSADTTISTTTSKLSVFRNPIVVVAISASLLSVVIAASLLLPKILTKKSDATKNSGRRLFSKTMDKSEKELEASLVGLEKDLPSELENQLQNELRKDTQRDEALSAIERKKIEEYLKAAPKHYRTGVNGKKLVWELPREFSLGTFSDGINKFEGIDARGHAEVDPAQTPCFRLSEATLAYPVLLDRFYVDELNWIVADTHGKRNVQLAKHIGRLKCLHTIETPTCAWNNDDFKQFEDIRDLKGLNINDSTIDGALISKSRLVKSLAILVTSKMTNVRPLLDAAIKYQAVNYLTLNYTDMDHSDFQRLSKIKSLHSLQIRGTSATDDDIRVLTKLDLVGLNVKDCTNLTRKTRDIARAFPHLKEFDFPAAWLTDEEHIEKGH